MHPVARIRHVLARRPWLYWATVLVLAAGLALVATTAVADVEEARLAWGSSRAVVVATVDLAPGDALTGRTEVRRHPAPMVPATAIGDAAPNAVVRQHVAAGEVLVDLDVSAGRLPIALIPPGWRGVPIAEAVPSGASVGDRVAATSGGVLLAEEGTVVGRLDQTLVVAVPATEAPAVAMAAASGELTLLLVP